MVTKNIQKNDVYFLIVGIVGAIIILYGFTNANTKLYDVIGSFLLLFTAIYFEETFFIALQIILLASYSSILLGINPTLQIILPSLLCLQFLSYYILSGNVNNIFRISGIIGIALLSIGFTLDNQWLLLFGGISIASFATYKFLHGCWIAVLWAILNIIFTLIAAFKLIF